MNVLHPLCPSYSGLSDHEITLKLMSFLLRCLTEEVSSPGLASPPFYDASNSLVFPDLDLLPLHHSSD